MEWEAAPLTAHAKIFGLSYSLFPFHFNWDAQILLKYLVDFHKAETM